MAEFNICDEVKDLISLKRGVVKDKMYSEAQKCYVYLVLFEDGSGWEMRTEREIEPAPKRVEYKIEATVADGVVIGVIYELTDNSKTEVCRGHGHVIHEGAIGIAQACAYAFKRAFASIDEDVYHKQNRKNEA